MSITNQPLHLSLAGILAAALPSFILPNCLAYWTFLVNFGFFGLVSIYYYQWIISPTHLSLPTGDRVSCGLHLPCPRLTPWSSCPFSCVWPGQLLHLLLLSMMTSTNQPFDRWQPSAGWQHYWDPLALVSKNFEFQVSCPVSKRTCDHKIASHRQECWSTVLTTMGWLFISLEAFSCPAPW